MIHIFAYKFHLLKTIDFVIYFNTPCSAYDCINSFFHCFLKIWLELNRPANVLKI